MAKRELSSTLKNLKFMQRTAPREEKIDEQKDNAEPKGSVIESFITGSPVRRRCKVIIEGDPHPGALRGRMSFQNFNLSIDKLNEEAATISQSQASNTSNGNESISHRDEESEDGNQENILEPNLQKKQLLVNLETQQSSCKSEEIESRELRNPTSSNKQKKREKLDWNFLRPPKAQKNKKKKT